MTNSQLRVTIMLCDHAQVADGKLFISGGGWSITGTPTPPSAIAILLQVPWSQANSNIRFKVRLVGSNGETVTQPNLTGQLAPVEVTGEFEVERPPDLPDGTQLEAPIAINIPPLLLQPGRYTWELWVDEMSLDEWQVSFLARASSL